MLRYTPHYLRRLVGDYFRWRLPGNRKMGELLRYIELNEEELNAYRQFKSCNYMFDQIEKEVE